MTKKFVDRSFEEDAQYLRTALDSAENTKVMIGRRLNKMLTEKFGGDRRALRCWYECSVWEGKAHRSWNTVENYLGVVRHPEKYPDPSAEFARRAEVASKRKKFIQSGLREDAEEFRKQVEDHRRQSKALFAKRSQNELEHSVSVFCELSEKNQVEFMCRCFHELTPKLQAEFISRILIRPLERPHDPQIFQA